MTQAPAKLGKLAIRNYRPEDREALLRLWDACDLLRPWNDPDEDIALAAATPNSQIFVGTFGGTLCASCLVGHDGHRGWLYYLATEPQFRSHGFGSAIVRHCETWLRERHVPKVQLLIRPDNLGAKSFYAKIGYRPNPCHIMEHWLIDRGAPDPVPHGRADGKLELTITYLEMTARPKQPPLPPPQGAKVALLRAVRPTVSFYRFLYDRVGEAWLWWLRRALDDDALKQIIEDDRVEIYVLHREGVPAGFAELDRREPPEIKLAYFGLMPEFIGRGLGAFLMSSVIDIAWSYEPSRLTVSTNTLDHPKALGMYQRFGFVPTERADFLVDDPRLIGLIPPA